MTKDCTCSRMSNAGDMAPRLWECETHGKTGMAAFGIMYDRQQVFPKPRPKAAPHIVQQYQDEFWFFCRGVLAAQRAKNSCYACEDHLWSDIQKELKRQFGAEALG